MRLIHPEILYFVAVFLLSSIAEERKSQLRVLVKQAYYRLASARQIRKITEKHVNLIEQLIDAVRIKYEVGRAAQSDLLRLEVLRSRLKDSIEDFDRQDRELAAGINASVHRQLNRYRDQLVPEAHEALDSTFSSYQVDRADFSSLYEAELDLLNFEKTIRIAAVQGLLARTRIEQLIGRKL